MGGMKGVIEMTTVGDFQLQHNLCKYTMLNGWDGRKHVKNPCMSSACLNVASKRLAIFLSSVRLRCQH